MNNIFCDECAKNLEAGMVSNKARVSIIVLNYNGKRYLEDCFQSLKSVDYMNFEVVMVDNKSTDDSVDFVREHFKWVRIIEAPGNSGFAAGNNLGIKSTKGKYIFLLNNDTICTPNFLSMLVDAAESDMTIGIAGAWPLDYGYRQYKDKVSSNNVVQVSAIAGAVMLIRRDVLEKIGLLDEKFFLYWEDAEFCWRTTLLGYKVVQVYDSFVFHLVNATGLPTKRRWMREFVKNKIYAHIKLMNGIYLGFFLLSEMVRSAGRMALHPVLAPSVLEGWWWNLQNLHANLNERKKIRSLKKISDWDLLKLMFRDYRRDRRDWKRLRELAEEDRKNINSVSTQKDAT
jgi:GT2 family glycosyltransferase